MADSIQTTISITPKKAPSPYYLFIPSSAYRAQYTVLRLWEKNGCYFYYSVQGETKPHKVLVTMEILTRRENNHDNNLFLKVTGRFRRSRRTDSEGAQYVILIDGPGGVGCGWINNTKSCVTIKCNI